MSFLPAVDELLNNIIQLDEGKAWIFAIDSETKDEIIRLITQEQLFDQGVDGEGRKLGDYTPFTKELKRLKGQRTDHITLKDTGAFYNSFEVQATRDSLVISADDESLYDEPLTQVYGIDILSLTEDSRKWLFDFLIDKYREYIERELFQ